MILSKLIPSANNAKHLLANGFLFALDKSLMLSHELPANVQATLVLNILQKTLAEPINEGDLNCLQGHWLAIKMTNIGKQWYFTLQGHKINMQPTPPTLASSTKQVCISGHSHDLLRLLGRSQDPDTLFFQRRLSLTGDTELGLQVRNVLDGIDWEDSYWQTAAKLLNHSLHWASARSEG